ncbi:hypothetical protein [Tychonema sp. LEGE 07203]|uniref:hypothetical protein n=1 Tax=Tychonema sp. LEGE 07203 TaxID=1828671 RepID=UPI001880C7B7|nr:hypothetical protein [Tychonema sp. LEGE 07203]
MELDSGTLLINDTASCQRSATIVQSSLVFATRPNSVAFRALLTASRKLSGTVAKFAVSSGLFPAVAGCSFKILPTKATTAIANIPVTSPTTIKVDRNRCSNATNSGDFSSSILLCISSVRSPPILATAISGTDSPAKLCCSKVLLSKLNS